MWDGDESRALGIPKQWSSGEGKKKKKKQSCESVVNTQAAAALKPPAEPWSPGILASTGKSAQEYKRGRVNGVKVERRRFFRVSPFARRSPKYSNNLMTKL